jgi:ABC-2 type transport system permease protein
MERSIEVPAFLDEMPHVIHAEWIKIRTQRSVWWTLAGLTVPTLALVLGMALTASPVASSPGVDRTGILLAPVVTTMLLMQIGMAVVGALFVSNEFNHGMIRSSLMMAPRRLRFLSAKLVVIGCFGFVLGVLFAVVSVVLSAMFNDAIGTVGALLDLDLLRAVLGAGLYLGTLGVFATSVAILMRHTAGVVLTMIGVVYVVPLIVFPLLPVLTTAGEFWPTLIGLTVMLPDDVAVVGPWLGWAVFAAETAVLAMLSAAVFSRRDA